MKKLLVCFCAIVFCVGCAQQDQEVDKQALVEELRAKVRSEVYDFFNPLSPQEVATIARNTKIGDEESEDNVNRVGSIVRNVSLSLSRMNTDDLSTTFSLIDLSDFVKDLPVAEQDLRMFALVETARNLGQTLVEKYDNDKVPVTKNEVETNIVPLFHKHLFLLPVVAEQVRAAAFERETQGKVFKENDQKKNELLERAANLYMLSGLCELISMGSEIDKPEPDEKTKLHKLII